MKLLFSSADLIAVSQLKDFLESQGVACILKNEILTSLSGEVPFADTFPELWVQNDTDFQRAAAMKSDWKAPPTLIGSGWTCSNCGEQLEKQFSSCWKCGTPRASTPVNGG